MLSIWTRLKFCRPEDEIFDKTKLKAFGDNTLNYKK